VATYEELMPEITLPQGTIHYRDEGAGPPLVFVHGALVNGRLWEPVVERLAGDVRCIVPDLPLGSHTRPMAADADLSPTGLARLIADFIAALDLEDVTLVGNDTGGALCQLVVGRHPERLARLALTNCDAFENFPPKAFRGLVIGARTRTLSAAMQPMRLRSARRLPLAYGWLTKRPVPDDVLDSWVEPYLSDRGIRRDTRRFLAAVDPAFLHDNVARLTAFDRPVLIAWAPEDRFFPIADARRLAAVFPDARVEEIADARTFVSWDQPERLAELLRAFVRPPAAGQRADGRFAGSGGRVPTPDAEYGRDQ
jgi:pimeloyl-ACP methyl ester carboxylesterase